MPASVAQGLTAYLAASQAGGFDWARRNCAMFVAGWVRCQTGHDALAGISASTPFAWARAARARGGVCAAVSAALGLEAVPAQLAGVGDVVLMPAAPGGLPALARGTGVALGICCGRTAACLASQAGIVHVAMQHALCAWPLSGVATRGQA